MTQKPNQQCSNCNAWLLIPGQKDVGECRAKPPVPLFMGMQEIPIARPAIVSGQQPRIMNKPIVHAAFPNMKNFGWCREWQPQGYEEGTWPLSGPVVELDTDLRPVADLHEVQRELLVQRAKAAGCTEREIVITGGEIERLTALCEVKERMADQLKKVASPYEQ